VLPIDYGPPTDPHISAGTPVTESVWIEPYPDEQVGLEDGYAAPEARYELRESVELAFIAALQHLPPRQRAVLICREVLGFSAAEVAETLDTTVASVNSALQRARKAIDEKLPERSQQATLRDIGDEQLRELVATYVDAWQRGDVEAIVCLLAEDAVIAMPPMAAWFRGDGVRVFLEKWAFSGRLYDAEGRRRVRVIPTRASGQPAFGTYSWDPEQEVYVPKVIQVITLDGGRIAEITGFVDPAAFAGFGLPDRLPAD
jgi:RNA polymerase sigma-70 factor (ECF subfamily)